MIIKKNKTTFIVLVSLLTIVVVYWVFSVIIIDRNNYSEIKQGMIEADNNFTRISNERANYTTIKSTREEQLQYFDTLKIHIPFKENVKGANSYIETLDIIHRIAEKNNVTIIVLKPILENTFPQIEADNKILDQRIERYLVKIECNGDFISIGKFFEELQNQERIINLLKFNIATEYEIKGNLFCEALLYTYVFSDYN